MDIHGNSHTEPARCATGAEYVPGVSYIGGPPRQPEERSFFAPSVTRPCPHCGRCPCCGRGVFDVTPRVTC